MTSAARLFVWLVVRSALREKVRTAIAVIGIALGVAVMLAVRLANRSATDTFRVAVDTLHGRTDFSIRGTTGRVPERLLADLRWLQDYGAVSPVIDAYVQCEERKDFKDVNKAVHTPSGILSTAGSGERLHLLGIDILADRPVRDYHLLRTAAGQDEPTVAEMLGLLKEPDAIILTERFAQRKQLHIDDEVNVLFSSTRHRLKIRGLLRDEGPARLLDGQFAVMDIAAAQWAAGRLSYVDRVDIVLHPGLDRGRTMAEIAPRLPTGLVLELPQADAMRADTMIAAFQFNLAALSGVALLVGLFMIYNTIAISAAARREELGILHALGARPGSVAAVLLAEALAIGTLGIAIGLPLGRWMAIGSVMATSQTVETFFIAETARNSARQLSLDWNECLAATSITLLLVLIAAALPAWRAARMAPVEILRETIAAARRKTPGLRGVILAAGLSLLGLVLCYLPATAGLPLAGFAAELTFLLAGALVVPWFLWMIAGLTRRMARFAGKRYQAVVLLAGSNVAAAIDGISISVAALAVSLAMMVAMAVMVGSFRSTVVAWLNYSLKADLLVRPATLSSSMSEAEIDPTVMEQMRTDPDVASLGWIRLRQIPYGRRKLCVSGGPLDLAMQHKALFLKQTMREGIDVALREAEAGKGAFVSESFALLYRLGINDTFSIPTLEGEKRFRIVAIYFDYSSNEGAVLLHWPIFLRYFAREPADRAPSSVAVYLRPGVDPEEVRERWSQTIAAKYGLYLATQDNVRREAIRIFESTFTVTYALQAISIVIAALGVVATLLTLIYQRRREIAVTALLGAEPRQIRRMIVIEALQITLASQLVGMLIGLVMSLVLIYVINVQSFGWTIQLDIPWLLILETGLLIIAATILCGNYPAIRAAQINVLQVAREE